MNSSAPSGQLNGRDPASGIPGAGSNGRRLSLHRIAEVRKQQGVSLRTAARRWNLDVAVVRQQEEETTDLMLSDLYRWQILLEVPVGELLVDEDQPLSVPVMRRAQLLRLMKTAITLQRKTKNVQVQRLALMLTEQLIEIMPELANIGPWQGTGLEDENGNGFNGDDTITPVIVRISDAEVEDD